MDHHTVKLPWQDPLKFAKKICHNYQDSSWIFLYSALHDQVKNSHSYIALFLEEKLICDDFFAAEKILSNNDKKWFGYLSYEVGQQFEKLPKTRESIIPLPKIWLMNFAIILEFDHDKKILTANFSDQKKLEQVLQYKSVTSATVYSTEAVTLDSNFTDQSYLQAINYIRKKIAGGDFYQTNLTRKFFGKFAEKTNHQQAFQMFFDLTKISPANYSSFLKLDDNYIISSSPELFLSAKKGKILSRPIKGTTARSTDSKQDKKNKISLKNSAKERAENLMIVDLVRNDLSRICKAGSVVVNKLFNITSYKNVHHMSSEIHGRIADDFSTLDALKSCFPAGSMTGAPKIKAMTIAAKKEQLDRGIYSGTIGMFSRHEINCSVVIRTLILRDEKFEFQVGGAITFDSDPKSELEEIFNKARGIFKLLQLKL